MSGFDLVFAMFGLVLGMAITEVLAGLARALRLQRGPRDVRIGWLTPMLGVFVMLDLTSFWMVAFGAREQIGANYLTLIMVLAIVGIYYLAASLIFPDDPEDWPDFDEHYDRQHKMVIGGLLAANLLSSAGQIALEVIAPTPDADMPSDFDAAVDGLTGLGVLVLLFVLWRVTGRRANGVVLGLLIALLLVGAVLEELA